MKDIAYLGKPCFLTMGILFLGFFLCVAQSPVLAQDDEGSSSSNEEAYTSDEGDYEQDQGGSSQNEGDFTFEGPQTTVGNDGYERDGEKTNGYDSTTGYQGESESYSGDDGYYEDGSARGNSSPKTTEGAMGKANEIIQDLSTSGNSSNSSSSMSQDTEDTSATADDPFAQTESTQVSTSGSTGSSGTEGSPGYSESQKPATDVSGKSIGTPKVQDPAVTAAGTVKTIEKGIKAAKDGWKGKTPTDLITGTAITLGGKAIGKEDEVKSTYEAVKMGIKGPAMIPTLPIKAAAELFDNVSNMDNVMDAYRDSAGDFYKQNKEAIQAEAEKRGLKVDEATFRAGAGDASYDYARKYSQYKENIKYWGWLNWFGDNVVPPQKPNITADKIFDRIKYRQQR